jgi:hypothetical protein
MIILEAAYRATCIKEAANQTALRALFAGKATEAERNPKKGAALS